MAFKKCTVASAKVAATLTDYPTYVDLARVGVTTLAEAQSIRVYADESKTTEWARDIVSATEMHVKVPSLTTTTVIYVDFDGVRSDYGVTDTYGRNAVWGDYLGVFHTQEGTGTTLTDSSGNANGSVTNALVWDNSDGPIGGSSLAFGGSYYAILSALGTVSNITYQSWVKRSTPTTGSSRYWGIIRATGPNRFIAEDDSGAPRFRAQEQRNESAAPNYIWSNPPLNTWFLSHVVSQKNAQIRVYGDASLKGQANNSNRDIEFNNLNLFAGTVNENGSPAAISTAKQTRIRIRLSDLSANWITTEYNNQDDEATFWPTWEDVGGGAVTKKGFLAWL